MAVVPMILRLALLSVGLIALVRLLSTGTPRESRDHTDDDETVRSTLAP